MRILLVGRDGQLGRALGPVLAPLGTVVVTGRAELDLSRPRAVAATLDDLAPDLIVNAAAWTDVDRAEAAPEAAFVVNAEAPGALAAWAARNGGAIIHYSTDYVFDGAGGAPYDEAAPPAPINVYGQSKLAGERAIAASGAAHLVLRTSWLYDARGPNFLTAMLRRGRASDEVRVVADQTAAPTPAALVAGATAAIVADAGGDPRRAFETLGGTLHLAAAGATTRHGFAEAIFAGARARGLALRVQRLVPISSAEFGAAARRPADSRLALDRARARRGFAPPDWRAALATVLDEVARAAPLRGCE